MNAAPAVRRLTRLAARIDGASDADLLRKYVADRNSDAFAALVDRHGPMVLGVCRRVTGDTHAAEDAYQAAFLALARRAGTIRSAEALPAWLFGTARRVALRARDRLGRHRTVPPTDTAAAGPDPLDRLSARELLGILDDELARLPAKYRSAVVLCTLEGSTVEAAAGHLGSTPGAVRGWLQRGRERLRRRLERRGLALSALVALGAGVAPPPSVAAVARGFSAKSAAVPPAVAGLLVRPWLPTSLTALVLVAASVTGIGFALFPAQGAPPEQKPPAKGHPVPAAVEKVPAPAGDQYGDPLPAGVIARLGTMRLRHGDTVYSVTFSPDGRQVASTGTDGIVHVWDAATGQERLRIAVPSPKLARGVFGGMDTVTAVTFSPDGRYLAATPLNQPPMLWDARTGENVRNLGDDNTRSSWVRFSPDTKYVAFDSGAGGLKNPGIQVAEVATGKRVAANRPGEVFFPADADHYVLIPGKDWPASMFKLPAGRDPRAYFQTRTVVEDGILSGDGRRLITREIDKAIQVWDIATEKVLARFEGAGDGVSWMVSAPDGKTVLIVGNDATRLSLLDVETAKPRWDARLDPKRDRVSTATFLPTGEILTGHEYGMVRAWDPATGKERRSVRPQSWNEVRLAVSPDGKTMATAVNSPHEVGIVLTDTATFKPTLPDRGHQTEIRGLAFRPDGRQVATGAWDGSIRLWEPRTGKPVRTISSPAMGALAYSADGKRLYAAGWSDGKVRVYDPETGKAVREWDSGSEGLRTLVVSVDGRILVTAGKTVRAWDATSGKLLREFDAPALPLRVALSPNGESVAVAGFDRALRFYDLGTGAKRFEMRATSEQIGAIAFSPDGRLLAWSDGPDGVRLTDAPTGRHLNTLPGKVDPLDGLAFSKDGRALVWGSSQNTREVRVWEVQTGRLRRTLHGHDGPAGTVAFSPDGSLLLTAGPDGAPLVWDYHGREGPRQVVDRTQLETWWDTLAKADAAGADALMARLRAAGPAAVALIRDHLPPAVRPDAKELAALVADLDSDAFRIRERASRELERHGESAAGVLARAATDGKTEEARTRARRLLEALDAGRLKQTRVVEVLEGIGNAAAVKVLTGLAGGAPDSPLTRDAAAAVKRLRN